MSLIVFSNTHICRFSFLFVTDMEFLDRLDYQNFTPSFLKFVEGLPFIMNLPDDNLFLLEPMLTPGAISSRGVDWVIRIFFLFCFLCCGSS